MMKCNDQVQEEAEIACHPFASLRAGSERSEGALAMRISMALNRLGLALGTQHVLSIPGRKTGKLRSTPVSLLTVDGRRYIATGLETDWVKNARASGWGLLTRGWKKERVALVELPIEERAPILREFPHQVPQGVQFFERLLGLPNDPEAFAAAAPHCPAFRIDGVSEDHASRGSG